MKCPNCKGTLNLEHKFCPHCGTVNEQAKKHIENMKKYQEDYEETKTEVYQKAHKNSEITSKSIILAVLLFILVSFIIAFVVLDDLDYEIREKNLDKYIEENKERLLNEKNYYIYGRISDIPIYSTYSYIYDMIMEFHEEKNAERRYFNPQHLIEYIIRFYEYKKDERTVEYYKVPPEEITNIETQIKALLVAYCDFTKEEAENLENLSNGELTLLMEVKLNETKQ